MDGPIGEVTGKPLLEGHGLYLAVISIELQLIMNSTKRGLRIRRFDIWLILADLCGLLGLFGIGVRGWEVSDCVGSGWEVSGWEVLSCVVSL